MVIRMGLFLVQYIQVLSLVYFLIKARLESLTLFREEKGKLYLLPFFFG